MERRGASYDGERRRRTGEGLRRGRSYEGLRRRRTGLMLQGIAAAHQARHLAAVAERMGPMQDHTILDATLGPDDEDASRGHRGGGGGGGSAVSQPKPVPEPLIRGAIFLIELKALINGTVRRIETEACRDRQVMIAVIGRTQLSPGVISRTGTATSVVTARSHFSDVVQRVCTPNQ